MGRLPDAVPSVMTHSNLTRTNVNVNVLLGAKLTRPRTETTALALITHAIHALQEKEAPQLLPTLPRPPSQVAHALLLMEKIHVMLFMEVSSLLRLTEPLAQLVVMIPVKEKENLVLPNSSLAPWFSPPLF